MPVNLGELVTTTLRNRAPALRDLITKNTVLLNELSKAGKIKKVSGGRTIVEALMFAENQTAMYYSGYETLDITPQTVIDAAEYDWKQAAATVTISGREAKINSGKEALIDLLDSRVEAAEISLKNLINAGLYSDGTGSGGKQITGLQAQVADTPTSGTVGGIDRATYSWWRNVSYDSSSDGGAAFTSATAAAQMLALYVQLVRGADKPNLLIGDNSTWSAYNQSLQSIQRITRDDKASAGFATLEYMGAPFYMDGGYGGACPTGHLYMLNTNYLKFVVQKDTFFDAAEDVVAINQDATVRKILFMGELTMGCAFLQGVLKP